MLPSDCSESAGQIWPSGREWLRARMKGVHDVEVNVLGYLTLGDEALRRLDVEGMHRLGQNGRHTEAHEAKTNGHEELHRTLGEVKVAVSEDDLRGGFADERLNRQLLSRLAQRWGGQPTGRVGVDEPHLLQLMLRIGELLANSRVFESELTSPGGTAAAVFGVATALAMAEAAAVAAAPLDWTEALASALMVLAVDPGAPEVGVDRVPGREPPTGAC